MAFELLHTFVRISVRGEKDVDKAFARQEKNTLAAEKNADKIGDSYEKSAKKSEGAIGRVTKKIAELNGATNKVTKKPSVLSIKLDGYEKVSAGLKTLGRERDNLEKGRITLTTTLEGSREVLADFQQIEGVKSRIDGDKVTLTVDVDGTAEGTARLERFEALASRIDGDELRANIEVTGSAAAVAELSAVNVAANRVDGRNIGFRVDPSSLNILDRVNTGLGNLATRIRTLSTIGGTAVIPSLIAAIAMLIPIATSAGVAVLALVGAIGQGLAGAAAIGGGAMGVLAAGFGLITAPVTMLVGKLADYEKGLEQAATAQEGVTSAQRSYESALESVEQAEDGREAALDEVVRATEEAARAQQEYNDALEDEPTNQAQNELDLDEAIDREDDAQRDYNDAVKEYGENSEEASDALREWRQAQLDLDQQQRDSQRVRERGSDQLQSAERGLETALEARQRATEGLVDANERLVAAQEQAAQSLEDIATAEQGVLAATVALTPAQLALYDAWVRFKDIAGAAFLPAQDQAARLGVMLLTLAGSYMPRFGQTSLAVMKGLTEAFRVFRAQLSGPVEQSGIARLLAVIPGAMQRAATAAGYLGLALFNIFARSLKYVNPLLTAIQSLMFRFLQFTRSAEGQNAIDSFFARSVARAKQLGLAILNLLLGFVGLFSALGESGAVDRMMAGFVRLTESFREFTRVGSEGYQKIVAFGRDSQPILDAVWRLVSALVTEWFRAAEALVRARTEAGKLAVPAAIDGLIKALPIIGDLLINTFTRFGPLLGPLVSGIAGLLDAFIAHNPVLLALSRIVVGVLSAFNNLSPTVRTVLVTVASLGSVLSVLGVGFVSLFNTVGVLVGGLGTLATFFGVGLLPLLGVVALAIAAVAVGAMVLYRNWSTVTAAFRAGVSVLRSVFSALRDAATPALAMIKASFVDLKTSLAPVVAVVSGLLRGALARAFQFVLAQAKFVQNWWTQNLPLMRQTAQTVFGFIGAFIGSSLRVAAAVIRTVFGAAMRFYTANSTQIRNITSQVWRIVTTLIRTALSVVGGLVRAAMLFINGRWREGFTELQRVGMTILRAVVTVARSLLSLLGSVFKIALNAIWGVVKTVFTSIKDSIVARLTESWNRGKEIVNGLKDSAISAFNSLRDKAGEIFDSVKERIVGPVEEARDRLKEIWNDILEGIATVLDVIPGLGDLASDVRGAKFETGGSTDAKASRSPSGYAGGRAFATGGVIDQKKGGVSGPRDPRYHLWGEGDYDEAYLSTDPRFRRNNDNYAAWYADKTGGVYWPAKTRKIAESYTRMADLMRRGKFYSGQKVEGAGPHRRGRMGNVASDPRWQGSRFFRAGGLTDAEAASSDASKAAQATTEWAHQYDGRNYLLGGSHPGETDCSGWQNVVFLRYSGNTSPSGRTPYGSTMNMDSAVPSSGAQQGSANPGYTVGWYNGGPAGGHTAGTLATATGETNTETGGSHNSTMTGGPAAGANAMLSMGYPGQVMSYGSPGDIKGGGGGGGMMDWVRQKVEALWDKLISPIIKKLEAFGPHVLARGAGQISINTLEGIKEWVLSKIPVGGGGAAPDGPGVGGPGGGDPAANRALGEEMLKASGVPGSFSSLDQLWQKESGWSQTAENASSGAYGIPQALPPEKMGAAANPPESNPRAQIDWGLGYIQGRYGSTDDAWAHSQQVGWYSEGGIATGDQLMRIAEEGAQELVIPLKGRGAQIARDALGVANLREEMRTTNQKLDGVIDGLTRVGLDAPSREDIKTGSYNKGLDAAGDFAGSTRGQRAHKANTIRQQTTGRVGGGG